MGLTCRVNATNVTNAGISCSHFLKMSKLLLSVLRQVTDDSLQLSLTLLGSLVCGCVGCCCSSWFPMGIATCTLPHAALRATLGPLALPGDRANGHPNIF